MYLNVVRSALKIVANAVIITGLALLVYVSTLQLLAKPSLNLLGLVIVNTIYVVLYAARRDAKSITSAPGPWLVATIGTVVPFLMRPTAPGAAVLLGTVIQGFGLVLIAAAILSLQRSFGIVPANRGVRQTGLYRFVRHPLYGAELLALLGFVVANPSVLNASLWACGLLCQVVRAVAEERHLGADPVYRDYQARVRYRVIPGLL